MYRLTLSLMLLCLGILKTSSPCIAQEPAEPAGIWANRLAADTKQLFEEEGSDSRDTASLCELAACALALVGRADEAVSLSRECLNEDALTEALTFIAAAQSSIDDVEGAFRTADLLPPDTRQQRTRALIVIRQAQRGDLEDSVELLGELSDPEDKRRARAIIIEEMLKAKRYRQSLVLYSSTKGDERESIRDVMERVREDVEPGDPNYIEQTIKIRRRLRSQFGGLSEDGAARLRLECQARVAIHEGNEAAFRSAIDKALRLIADWDTADRCSALLTLGALCSEFGDDKEARRMFLDALDALFKDGKAEFGEPRFYVYFGLATGDRFNAIARVMSESELHRLADRLIAIDSTLPLLGALGQGIAANEKDAAGHAIYGKLLNTRQKVQFGTGVLEGIAKRTEQRPSALREKPAEKEQQESLAAIDRIIADKPPLEFITTGKHRPKREYLGAYNVPKDSLPGYEGEIWQEKEQLPELTLEEFFEVRSAVVMALWGHGSVYGLLTIEGDFDFFVWDDKFCDRTQKVEIEPFSHLPEILPGAVADIQKALAKHPTWRVMFLGHGENVGDEYFVVYPDAIRILQASETDSMTEAIEANARLRAVEK